MATSLTAALAKGVREEIPRGLREVRQKLDPVWTEIISTSRGVTREGLGRDWKFLMTFVNGLAGAYQFETDSVMVGPDLGGPSGDLIGNAVARFGAGNGWPGRAETTAPALYQKSVRLKEARGNLVVPLKWAQIDAWDSSVGPMVRKIIQGTARKTALYHTTGFFTKDAGAYPIVDNMASSGSAASHTITITNPASGFGAKGRINMIHDGMTLDLYDSAGTTKKTDPTTANLVLFVANTNYLGNSFKVYGINISTGAATAFAIANGDKLVLRQSALTAATSQNQPNGLNSWIKNTGTVFGIDLADFPIHGSLIDTAVTGPLTERMLTKYIGTFYERVGAITDLDLILTPAGVVHSYLENEDNLMSYERNGRRLSIKGGFADVDYAYEGRGFRWAISSFIEPKSCYVIKTGDQNIKEHVPPPTDPSSVGRGGRNSSFDNEIVFVAPFGGANGIYLHERNATTGAITDNLVAPFYRICEYSCEFPQSIKLVGLDESMAN